MPKIKINVRLAAILAVSGIVLIVTVLLVHAYQKSRQADDKLIRARRYAQRLNEEEMSVEEHRDLAVDTYNAYRSYLASYPDNVDVRFENAVFLYEQGNWVFENGNPNDAIPFWANSARLFEKALLTAEDRKDIREKFVDTLFERKDYRNALEHIKHLGTFPKTKEDLTKLFDKYDLYDRAYINGVIKKRQGQDPSFEFFLDYDKNIVSEKQLLSFLGDDFWMLIENSDLLNKLGQCHLYLNNLDTATECFKKSIDTSPSNIESYEFLIKILRSQDQSEYAEDWLTEVVKENPNAFRSYLIRGEDRLHRTRNVNHEHISKMIASAEWDALRAIQNAIEQLLESAYPVIPDSEATKVLQTDFNEAANLAPAIGKPVEKAYRDALMKAVSHVKPVAEQTKKHLAKSVKKDKKPASPQETLATQTVIDQSLEGCRDGLLLAVACETQKALLDKEKAKQHQQTARNMAHAVLDIFPNDAKVYLTLASIEFHAKNINEMIKWMATGAQKAKENTLILWQLGSVLISTGKMKKAQEILAELKKRGAKPMILLHLEAAFDVKNKNWSAAVLKLEKIRPEFVLQPEELRKIDVLLAECYGELDRAEDQRKAYARASSFDRSWRPALTGLAKSRIQSGLFDEAIKDYQIILRLPNVEPKRYLEYAKLLLTAEKQNPQLQRNYQRVEDAIRQAKIAMPNSLAVQMLEAEFLLTKGETTKAKAQLMGMYKHIGEIKQKILGHRKTLLDEAKVAKTDAERTKKLKQAEFFLAQARYYKSLEPTIWNNLVSIDVRAKNWQAADQSIQEAESQLGDSPTIRWLRAQKMVRKFGKDAAPELHALAEDLGGFTRSDRLLLLRNLSVLAMRLGDIDQAEKLAKHILKEEPADVEMQKVLFGIAKSRKDLKAMRTSLDEIQKLENMSAFWCYGEALRLYMLAKEQKDPKQMQNAEALLKKAQHMEPRWPMPMLLSAQMLQDKGKLRDATDLYLRAVRNGLQDPAVIQQLANLLVQQRRYKEADEMFNRLAQFQGNAAQNSSVPSYVKALLGDFDQSINMARETCEKSDNYRDFVWLGRVLGVAAKRAELNNQKDEAQKLYLEGEQAFNKAIQLKSSLPETWISFIQFYASLGKEKQALEALERAKKEVASKELDFMLAQSYETLGKVKNAATYYRKAVRNAPKDFDTAKTAILFFLDNNFTDEAKILLQRITKEETDANKQEIAWGKRALGYALVQQKGAGNINEALALLDENLKANPNSILDLYTKASLLSNDPTGLGHADAIKLFEQIKASQRNPGVAILQRLADLYYYTDQWNKFKETMRTVLGKAGNHPQTIATYAQRLAEHGEHGEAEVWLENLRGIDPEGHLTFSTECIILMEEGDHAAIIKAINKWISKKSDISEQKKRLERAAGYCQKFAAKLQREKKSSAARIMEKQAERFLKEQVKLDPKAEAGLTVLYAQQNNFDNTIMLLQKIAETDKTDPSLFALLVYACIREANFSENQLTQIQKLLKRVSESHPDNVFMKMTLAFCEENFERPQQAEAILRKALKEKPDSVPAMNYLAVTLALQEKDLDEARNLIEKVIKTAGPAPDFLDSRAMVSLAQNRPQAAIDDLREAIKIKPLAETFYFHLAEALYQKGFRRAAKNALKKAEKLGLHEAILSPMERRNYRRLQMNLR